MNIFKTWYEAEANLFIKQSLERGLGVVVSLDGGVYIISIWDRS